MTPFFSFGTFTPPSPFPASPTFCYSAAAPTDRRMRILTRYILLEMLTVFLITTGSMTVFIFLALIGKLGTAGGNKDNFINRLSDMSQALIDYLTN